MINSQDIKYLFQELIDSEYLNINSSEDAAHCLIHLSKKLSEDAYAICDKMLRPMLYKEVPARNAGSIEWTHINEAEVPGDCEEVYLFPVAGEPNLVAVGFYEEATDCYYFADTSEPIDSDITHWSYQSGWPQGPIELGACVGCTRSFPVNELIGLTGSHYGCYCKTCHPMNR